MAHYRQLEPKGFIKIEGIYVTCYLPTNITNNLLWNLSDVLNSWEKINFGSMKYP